MSGTSKAPGAPALAVAKRLLRPVGRALMLYGWLWLPGVPPRELFFDYPWPTEHSWPVDRPWPMDQPWPPDRPWPDEDGSPAARPPSTESGPPDLSRS